MIYLVHDFSFVKPMINRLLLKKSHRTSVLSNFVCLSFSLRFDTKAQVRYGDGS